MIPTYNRRELIGETLDHAIHQLIPFTRIIVVDDGSTDGTANFIQQNFPEVHTISITNSGVQAARNIGIDAANTELVTLCDSDDLLEPGFTNRIASWFSAHPDTDIVYTNFVTFNENETFQDKYSQAPAGYFSQATRDGDFLYAMPDLYRRSLQFQPFFASGLTLKKSFFNAIGRYNEAFRNVGAEDWEFTLRAVAIGNVAFCTQPLARIRRHTGNDSRDLLRMNLGEATILEYALQAHQRAHELRPEIITTIDERLRMAFDIAFATGDFATAASTLRRMRRIPSDAKTLLKRIIIAFPEPLRRAIWRPTQRNTLA